VRVITIGGAGDMGQVACETAVGDPSIDAVIVADRDEARATALAERLGPKGSAVTLDLNDARALAAAVADADIVLNTAGPFFRYGRPVLEAAITAGKQYADICDDWEPTLEMLELHEKARAAGTTAIVGIGASPGLSNLLAAVAHDQLDSVDTIYTAWRGGSGIPKAPENPDDVVVSAAMDHWIHNLADPIRIWRDGRFQEADALDELVLDYPGIGSATVWTCGHPEPITLPRTYPDVRNSLNVMFARPGMIDAARRVRDRVRAGELTVTEGSKEFILSPGRRGPDAGTVPAFPGIFACAVGTRDGRPARAVVSTNLMPEGEMGEATCIPLALAAGMLARGEITATGVVAPEAAIDPATMFGRLAPYAGDRADQPPLDVRVVTDEPGR
jgi:saccharopine dehydrogenase-like NADP-dependent oxidoreductase